MKYLKILSLFSLLLSSNLSHAKNCASDPYNVDSFILEHRIIPVHFQFSDQSGLNLVALLPLAEPLSTAFITQKYLPSGFSPVSEWTNTNFHNQSISLQITRSNINFPDSPCFYCYPIYETHIPLSTEGFLRTPLPDTQFTSTPTDLLIQFNSHTLSEADILTFLYNPNADDFFNCYGHAQINIPYFTLDLHLTTIPHEAPTSNYLLNRTAACSPELQQCLAEAIASALSTDDPIINN